MNKIKTFNFSVLLLLIILVGTTNSVAKNIIPYCIDPNWLPYESLEGNQHIGLSADYMQLLHLKTGYEFKLIPTKSWQQSLQFVQSGHCMLLPMLNQTPERSAYLDFSEVYFTSPNLSVTKRGQSPVNNLGDMGLRTLGLTQGYQTSEFVKKNHPFMTTITFSSEEAGLIAVSEGEVDVFIGSVHSINNHIENLGLTNLISVELDAPKDSLRMGVIQGQKSFLVEINQALASISKQQHIEIYNRWVNVKVIDTTNYKLIWQVVVVALFMLALLLVRYFSMRKYNQALTTKNRELNELQIKLLRSNSELQNITQKDALTELYNRHYFNELIAENTFNDPDKGSLCIIFIDLDFFKAINDNHGHVIGDHVLKVFGKLLKSCCDEGELVGRWGGEEFVILKQPANKIEAETLCQKVQHRMIRQVFPHHQPITCSFGIAQLIDDESLMACLDRADIMLYKAKDAGRNQICVDEG